MSTFTHLHVHTQYSILDGAANINSLIKKAIDYNMTSLAITDHGNMFGVIEFFNAALKAKIKPIIGCEIYVAEGSRFEKKGREDRSGYHLILLAKNLKGYYNLSRLCSMGYSRDSFYYTPRIDKDLLIQYHDGLIASSACLGGEIPSNILHDNAEKAESVLLDFIDIFGDDFYLELMRHGLPEQDIVNTELIRLAGKHKVKLIATNDVHFINKEDSEAHHILICLNTGRDINDASSMMYSGNEYLRTPEEMAALFSDIPEALENTNDIVSKIEDYSILRDVILPTFPLPEGYETESEYLRFLTYEGAKKRYPDLTTEVIDRIEMELKVIADQRFDGYFLIVQDFINEAKHLNVKVGPGRGSAAGSAVAYCTGITNLDPIKYDLLFERFLNPERKSMPDIDVDFDDEGREKVLKYVTDKYGQDHVAQIITFGTMAAKTSIRDVARVIKLPLQEADRLAKLVPESPNMTLKQAYADVPELKAERDNGSDLVRKTLKFAETLEGSSRHTGTHACGVIIGPDNLINHIPLSTAKDSELMVTQYEGTYIEKAGMLKMDFLGLKTLSIISDAIENIHKRFNILIDIDQIPLDDEITFDLFRKGDMVGVFQFESEGMRMYMKDLKPNNIEDLIAMNALYRPGPMSYIPMFIDRKHGKEKVEYPHPDLEPILKSTYGIMVYQEQIMQAARILAGYSLGLADELRKAMGKKIKETMEKHKGIFIEGAEKKGISVSKATEIYEIMQKFGEYGFNRSHSAAYSIIAFQTAYLKAHYPAEFMAATLTHNLNDIKKITFYIDECRRYNIHVMGPDVNQSDLKFTVNQQGDIHFGLAAIKGVGESAARNIIEERDKNGPYINMSDFLKRANIKSINKRVIEALAVAGAFDCFDNIHRAQFFQRDANEDIIFIEKLIRYAGNCQARINSSQVSLFGESTDGDIPDIVFPECEPWTKLEQLKREKEIIGFYISGNPLDDYRLAIDNFCNTPIEKLNFELEKFRNKEFSIGGIVTSVNHKMTKTGKPFGTFTIEDYSGSITISLFSENYLKFRQYLIPELALYIRGKVQPHYSDKKLNEINIVHISLLAESLDNFVKNIKINLDLEEINEVHIKELKELIRVHKGKCNLNFQISDGNMKVSLYSGSMTVNANDFLKNLSGLNYLEYKIN